MSGEAEWIPKVPQESIPPEIQARIFCKYKSEVPSLTYLDGKNGQWNVLGIAEKAAERCAVANAVLSMCSLCIGKWKHYVH